MKFKIEVDTGRGIHWEDYEENIKAEDIDEWGKALIQNYNDGIVHEDDLPRKYISHQIIDNSESDPNHDWQKSNLMTISKGGQTYDTAKCSKCGITGKRFGLGEGVSVDKKYSSKVYDRCDTAQEKLKGKRPKENKLGTAKQVKDKDDEQKARAQAEQDTVTEAYEELLGRVNEAKEVAANPFSVTAFMAYKNKTDDAVAAFKEASKLKSDSIETEDDIKAHLEASNKLKTAVKDMASYTVHYRIVCGDLSNFLAKHPLFTQEMPRSAQWCQTTGLIDVIQNPN